MSRKATGLAFDLQLPATRAKTTATRQTERGALVALFAAPIADTGLYGDTFLNIFIRTGGPDRTAGQVCLISDYIYEDHCGSWDGLYPLQENTFIVAEGRSGIAVTIRISGTINTEE